MKGITRRTIFGSGLLAATGLLSTSLVRAGHSAEGVQYSPALGNLRSATTRFGFELLCELSRRSGGEPNLAVSPVSLMAAFALADMGASPAFHSALQRTFLLDGGKDGDFASVRRSFGTLIAGVASTGPVSGFDAIYVDESVTLHDKAVAAFRDLGAQLESRRLADPKEVMEINALVRERTRGEIPTVIDGSLAGAGLVLVNAVYFKDRWESAFDTSETRQAEFHLVGSKTIQTHMMRSHIGLYSVARDRAFSAVQLPYATEGYSLIIVGNSKKPADIAEFAPAVGWLGGAGLTLKHARIAMPRFAFKGGSNLLPSLDALGLAPARSQQGAMAALSNSPLTIGAVPHKVAITVNEGGTTAAAATSIEMPTSAAPPPIELFEFAADKPFMFALRDDKSGMTLMIGYVGDPTKET